MGDKSCESTNNVSVFWGSRCNGDAHLGRVVCALNSQLSVIVTSIAAEINV